MWLCMIPSTVEWQFFEAKYTKSLDKLESVCDAALQQIDEKGYLIPYQTAGREVVKVGVEFSAEKRNIGRWLL